MYNASDKQILRGVSTVNYYAADIKAAKKWYFQSSSDVQRISDIGRCRAGARRCDRSYRAEQLEEENVKKILHDVLNEVHLKNTEGKGRQLDT